MGKQGPPPVIEHRGVVGEEPVTNRQTGKTLITHRAVCSCGWRARLRREDPDKAWGDAAEHGCIRGGTQLGMDLSEL